MKSLATLSMGLLSVATAACGSPLSGHSSVANDSISPDEIAIYETVLGSWLGKQNDPQLVSEQLSAAPSKEDPEFSDCAKGLNLSEAAQGNRPQKSLAGVQFKRAGVQLVDGSKWKPADPGEAIANGTSVDTAVREGFSHSLISFSQIAFTRDGKDALVKLGMVCGGLCGSGSTIHLRKSAVGWEILGRCGGWIS
jgi:hypothetical protein